MFVSIGNVLWQVFFFEMRQNKQASYSGSPLQVNLDGVCV